jgi:hypothetical protein
MANDLDLLIGKWTVRVKSWTWEYEFLRNGGVTWRDLKNAEKGSGTWNASPKLVNLAWKDSTTRESWTRPLTATNDKTWYEASYFRGKYIVSKAATPELTPPTPPSLRQDAPPDPKIASLDAGIKTARAHQDWQTVAELLNAFNTDDILARIAPLSEQELLNIESGAIRNPRVGYNAQIRQLIHDVISSVDPEVYGSPAPFPHNFGDKLGGVGGVVVAAAGGMLALRLAAPLLAGFWRQIQIYAGMTKIAAEADKEDAELARQEVGVVIDRLMNAGGGRVLVTYQTMSPAADKELYLTTEQGAQYAEAVAQGRNLYQLRIPERLFQVLQQRGLIEVRQGSMGNQVGDDIRIAAGAMQYLSKYIRQIPIK